MDRDGEFFTESFLSSDIVSSNFGVRATSAKSGFRIGFVFGVSVTTSRSSSHFRLYWIYKIFLDFYIYSNNPKI
jgi:hypothetical protein